MFRFFPKVSIQRKRKSFSSRANDWTSLFLSLANLFMFWGWGRSTEPTQLEAHKIALMEKQIAVADMRAAKLANDLVLQDLKIEEQKHKLKMQGVILSDPSADPKY